MNIEKMKEVFSDEAFVKGLFELESAAEVQAALKEKGVELTEEDILGIRDLLVKVESGEISVEKLENGELPEELLEQVAGGIILAFAAVSGGFVAGSCLLYGIGYGVADAITRRW